MTTQYGNRWTADEDTRCDDMIAAGKSVRQIAHALRRTPIQVDGRLRYRKWTQQQRDQHREHNRNRLRRTRHDACAAAARLVVPEHVVAEAQRAETAPRSITAALMGDPPPGRSALDRGGARYG